VPRVLRRGPPLSGVPPCGRSSPYPRGPRSGPGCAVPVHPHLLGPMRPTCRHVAISPQRGLYATPSLCGSAEATRKWFRAFAVRSVSTCRPLRPRRVRRLLAPSSFADDAGLRPLFTGSALPTVPPSASSGCSFSGLRGSRPLRPVDWLASLADPTGSPRPTETFTPELSAVRSPSSPSGMTTVATGQSPPVGLSPTRASASIAARASRRASTGRRAPPGG
jgi:hypothetical protein